MKKYIFLFMIFLLVNNSYGQQKKDSLFFYYDREYFKTYEYAPNNLYPKTLLGDERSFYFQKDAIHYNLRPKKILCLKKFLQSMLFKETGEKSDYNKLTNDLYKFEIFFVKEEKGKREYLQVHAGYEMY